MTDKINLGLIFDKIFRRTLFLRPLSDKSLEAVDITGSNEQFIKDKVGATVIDPACIVRVRGIKRVDYIAFKLSSAINLLNIFDHQTLVVTPPNVKVEGKRIEIEHSPISKIIPEHTVICPNCKTEHTISEETINLSIPNTPIEFPEYEVAVPPIEVSVPSDNQMTEKMFGDMLNYAEIAGRMQAEVNPESDKKQNWILLLVAVAVIVSIFIFFKIKGGGA